MLPPRRGQDDDQLGLAHEVLESVSRLTEQRDENALAHSLVEAFVEMIPGLRSGFVYLASDPETGAWGIDELHTPSEQACEPAPLDGQTYLLACLQEDAERREGIVMARSGTPCPTGPTAS